MAKLSQLTAAINAYNLQLEKALTEITTSINKLTQQLEDTEIPEDAQAELSRLAQLAQALDNIVPDAPAQPPAPEEPPVADPPPAEEPAPTEETPTGN